MKKFEDILNLRFSPPQAFTLASKMLDVRQKAERIAKIASKRQIENGEFATLFAENIIEWMQDLAQEADKALEIHIQNNTENTK
jgi:exonuclease V gamma subunit